MSHGLFARSGTVVDLASRCRAHLEVLPAGAAFSHLTLASLHDLWLPVLPPWLPVIATLPPRTLRPERRGMYVARSRARMTAPELLHSLPVVAPALMIGQLAEDLAVLDLVVAIDCALQTRLCSLAQIEAAIHPRQRGLPRLRRALSLADGRSESAWESILRVLYTLCGIPVEPQFVVLDSHGEFVARGDLRLGSVRRINEYDGAGHRTAQQHRRDLARDKALARIEWERFGYTAEDILVRPVTIIRDAEMGLGLPHQQDRVRGWWPVFRQSSLCAAGTARLTARLARYRRS